MTLRWGAFVPQGWKLELAGLSASDAWATAIDVALRAETLSYDHLWVYDHVETVPRRDPEHCFEAFTTLAALSQVTTRVQLGQMVTCVSYRNAGLLAKEAAGLDVMSGGRLILGLGAGGSDEEFRGYGLPLRAPGEKRSASIERDLFNRVPTDRNSTMGNAIREESEPAPEGGPGGPRRPAHATGSTTTLTVWRASRRSTSFALLATSAARNRTCTAHAADEA